MKLEFVRIAEANDLINQLIEHHPQSIFMTDSNFKIKFFNQSFQKLAQAEKADILEHEFCDLFGCSNRNKFEEEEKSHDKCPIRELLTGSSISELTLIRDFMIKNKLVTKHLHFATHRVVMNGVKYRLVIIDDRSQKH